MVKNNSIIIVALILGLSTQTHTRAPGVTTILEAARYRSVGLINTHTNSYNNTAGTTTYVTPRVAPSSEGLSQLPSWKHIIAALIRLLGQPRGHR